VDFDRFQLAAGGGERSGLDMLGLLPSFMLREGGGAVRRLNVSETVHVFWNATRATSAKCALIAVLEIR
jgi:hypothetical protein